MRIRARAPVHLPARTHARTQRSSTSPALVGGRPVPPKAQGESARIHVCNTHARASALLHKAPERMGHHRAVAEGRQGRTERPHATDDLGEGQTRGRREGGAGGCGGQVDASGRTDGWTDGRTDGKVNWAPKGGGACATAYQARVCGAEPCLMAGTRGLSMLLLSYYLSLLL